MGWDYQEALLAVCTLGFFTTMVARLAISPVVPSIIEDFAVSSGAVGAALTGMWLTYALSQFPSGVLGDRFGERSLLLASVLCLAPGSVLLALSPSFPVFVGGAVVLGVAAGFHFVPATSLLTKELSNTGRALGVYTTGAPLAGLVAPAVAVAVADRFGWRGAVLVGAVLAAPVFLLSLRTIRPAGDAQPDRAAPRRVTPGAVAAVLTRPRIAFMTALGALCMFAWQATASFLPLFLIAHRGLTPTTASLVFSAYFGVLLLSQPAMGELSDRYGRDRVLVAGLTGGTVAYLLLVATATPPALAVAVALLGVSMSWGGPLQSRFMDALDDAERGTNFGIARTVFMTLGSLGNVTVGVVADAAGWVLAFGLLSALLAAVVAALLLNAALGLDL